MAMFEGTAQKIAIQFVAEWMMSHFAAKRIHARAEAVLKTRGRADGLVIVKSRDDTILTASLEAKSQKTWDALKIRNETDLQLAMDPGGSLVERLQKILVRGKYRLKRVFSPRSGKTTNVIRQLTRSPGYPGEYQIIALPYDVWQRDLPHMHEFAKLCAHYGIGLLAVSSERKLKWMEEPRKRNSYIATDLEQEVGALAHYKCCNEVRQRLEESAGNSYDESLEETEQKRNCEWEAPEATPADSKEPASEAIPETH